MNNEASDAALPASGTAEALDANAPDLAPVRQGDRIASLDFIRGIAVMGILAANIVAFGQSFEAYFYPDAFLVEHGEVSDWLLVAQAVLVDNKMRGLFTLLFGAGLYLFMERAWARGATLWLQTWRLAILLVFGLIHYFLIWPGDILTYYALIGFAVLPFLQLKPVTQLGIGITAYVAGILFYGLTMTFTWLVAETDLSGKAAFAEAAAGMQSAKAQALSDAAVENALIQSGDYAGLVTRRLTEETFDPLFNTLFFAFDIWPLMLIGVAFYRLGFFSGEFDRRKMVTWGWAGVLVGGAISLAIALWLKAGGFTYYAMLGGLIGWSPLPRLLMVLGFAALLVAYAPRCTGWLGQRISAAGRAAFTNYLGTSVLMIFVFHGWGLGLYGEFARPGLYLVMVGAWVVMLAWSKPWLERYRYGPLEWLWRCLTYRKLFPLRR
ncbi:MAG: DUF418 domain-containing protein [Erythrobacter sp.]|uniref:DUF418 domain-containing protein n=1 Tax=Erythrobacter sp. TaxID=1042 RepID=UPI003C7577AF